YPVLIHCEFGAERTGLVSAMVKLLEPDGSLEAARDQFSIRYMFVPFKDGLVMLGHLNQYETWLKAHNRPHSSQQFRDWLAHDYHPGSPSREYWPCNPYPKLVVTAPGSNRVETSANACPQSVATRLQDDKTRSK
ncbi:MAG TPA: protein tyrosine phosphatase, partial [Isosphaeraceae bacterium]|nr:protein tyrosine phosphatase [Isosphaeraceae bacterium]